MNFKFIGLGIGAAVAVGAALNATPAQALSLGSTLNFGAGGSQVGNLLDFRDVKTPNPGVPGTGVALPTSDGSFSSLPLFAQFTVFDLDLLVATPQLFLDFANNDFDFTVTSISTIAPGRFAIKGLFGSDTPGMGELSTQFGASFSGGITAVPTPALVPAALGFGAAMLRKRKGEQSEQSEKEAAGVKA